VRAVAYGSDDAGFRFAFDGERDRAPPLMGLGVSVIRSCTSSGRQPRVRARPRRSSGSSGKERGGVAVGAEAEQDEIEARSSPRSSRSMPRTRARRRGIDLAAHAMDVVRRNRDDVQERLHRHAVVRTRIVRGTQRSSPEIHVDVAPSQRVSVRPAREQLVCGPAWFLRKARAKTSRGPRSRSASVHDELRESGGQALRIGIDVQIAALHVSFDFEDRGHALQRVVEHVVALTQQQDGALDHRRNVDTVDRRAASGARALPRDARSSICVPSLVTSSTVKHEALLASETWPGRRGSPARSMRYEIGLPKRLSKRPRSRGTAQAASEPAEEIVRFGIRAARDRDAVEMEQVLGGRDVVEERRDAFLPRSQAQEREIVEVRGGCSFA